MSPLTSKERVLIALRHEEPDRVPIDFGARHSIHISAHRALKRNLDLDDGADTVRSCLNNSAEPDPRLLARFATDVIAFPVGSGGRYAFRLDPETNSYTDEWGITMQMPPGGYYYDPVGFPLAAAQTVAEVERYPFPDPTDPHRLAGILKPIRIASAAGDKAILLNAPTVGIWWLAFYLRGLEQAMVDLGLQPELTEALAERITDWYVALWDAVLAQVGGCHSFWGGGCDTGILQHGSPAEVRDEVRRRLADLAPGGGFVFGSIHNIQVNVPPPNIVAMFDTARDESRYDDGRPVA